MPGLGDGILLHAGPPIEWERVCDPQRRALLAALFEELGERSGRSGHTARAREVALASGNEQDHVSPMTGVCSPSMPVWVVEDATSGAPGLLHAQRGTGQDTPALVRDHGDDESNRRLRFFRDDLGPRLARMLERRGPIDVFGLATARA